MDQRLTPPFFDPAAMRDTLTQLWREHDGDTPALRAALLAVLFDFITWHIYRAVNRSEAERINIIATGGYGRGLLAPASDIDLLFLLPYKKTPWGESIAEYMLYLLWDLGFKVGHATRTADQTVRFAKSDITTRTALLDARLILGDEALWKDFTAKVHDQLLSGGHREFITAKLEERDKRHERTGSSRYRVEPNIKDGKGGLRDLHTLYWIAKHLDPRLNGGNWVETGIFSAEEYGMYRRSEDFLWTIRCHLHFLAGKAEERLTFDQQPTMAERLHYRDRGGLMAVERFMKHYFLVAKDVGDLTRIVCSSLEVKQLKGVPQLNSLLSPLTWRSRAKLSAVSDFRIENGRMTAKTRDVFRDDPVNLIRLFALASQHNVLLHPEVIRLVRSSLHLIDDRLRADPEANRLFLEILTSRTQPEVSLRRMNEAGVLGRFIPDFGRVVSMMQFNMYHHFTVDEHSIRAVGVLSAIERGQLGDELPLSTGIIRNIANRRALYFAVFLHDIAKGRDEDHSIVGARIARALGPRLGLSPAETETAAWLVENHLVMSQFAQSRDLNDPKTIRDFANIVQSREMLMLLVILTAADIRAVGPGVWTGWKGQLLRTLYNETEPLLSGGHTNVPREIRIKAAQDELRRALKDWPHAELDGLITRHQPSYWLRTDLAHQIAHANLSRRARASQSVFAYDITTDSFSALTELTIWCQDRRGLIALIAGACSAAGANIVGAALTTTRDTMALNTFSLQRNFTEEMEERDFARRIATTIERLLKGEGDFAKLMAQKPRRRPRVEAFSVEPRVTIDNSLSDELTVIEVNGRDRQRLLFDLATVITELNINISSAHIATFGEKVVDVFYVVDTAKRKIAAESTQRKLTERLLEVLQGEPAMV
jgi:[protein-PII] uridylyltransferase